MSLYFDLVINCYFREEIREEHVKVLHWLVDKDYELDFTPTLTVNYDDYDFGNVWENMRYAPHMLAADPEREIISQLRRIHYTTIPLENNREVYLWLLQLTDAGCMMMAFIKHIFLASSGSPTSPNTVS